MEDTKQKVSETVTNELRELVSQLILESEKINIVARALDCAVDSHDNHSVLSASVKFAEKEIYKVQEQFDRMTGGYLNETGANFHDPINNIRSSFNERCLNGSADFKDADIDEQDEVMLNFDKGIMPEKSERVKGNKAEIIKDRLRKAITNLALNKMKVQCTLIN